MESVEEHDENLKKLNYFRSLWITMRPSNYWFRIGVMWNPDNPNQNLASRYNAIR